MVGKEVPQRLEFDNTFCDDRQAHAPGQGDDHLGDRGAVGIGENFANEGFVYLQLIQRQTLQGKER